MNDVVTRYLEMGAPPQLTPTQVRILCEQSNGDPDAVETIQVEPGKPFGRTIPMRKSDVDFVKIEPMDVK